MSTSKKDWTWEEDGCTVVRTCAWSPPGCHPVGCGLRLYVKDNRLVKVEGDPEHPISQGRLCIRCLSLPEYVHHPQRIIYPMKRVGERGENKWKRISWDEAWDIIVDKVNEIKEKYGPESIVVYGGTGRQACLYYYPLGFAVLGTPTCAIL
ncbi:MAG: molybdopterin-dependent oxidoreductase [Thermoanaerobacteraceae bacterium]|nr:molybdopterin-dependent oxidoreductase [Thermoanaerobacteraceae bacterium]